MVTTVPRPYTPSQENPADLYRRTVGRGTILETLVQRLRSAATTRSCPHTLLVGPRGSGKTHLLSVVRHLIGRDAEIRDHLAFAVISEDAVGITRYRDLVWEIGAALGLTLPRSMEVVALESAVLESLEGRTLVLVVENLDRVFKSLGTPGQQDLRSWVETSGRIMLLAATPALFAGVKDRRQPWFAGMIMTPVDGLTSDQGRELLIHLAKERGDDELAAFLESDRGRGRVEAVARLTGGSPRIWMVLAECITIENLDALVPAVEQLVEGLVPYYQQLLWDLSDNHQAVVRQLAEGDDAAMTAAEISAATGLSQQTVSKALNLLQEGRWVRSQKVEDDRRKTWYSLREPMLRHHFQWRATSGEPLRLIVELLKAWHDPAMLRRHLASVEPLSPAETYLATALRPTFDEAYEDQDPEALAALARRWIVVRDDVYTRDCGRYVEACLAISRDPHADLEAVLRRRDPAGDHDEAVVNALRECRSGELSALFQAAANATHGDTRAGLVLVAAGWIGHSDAASAVALLTQVEEKSVSSRTTWFAIQIERIFWRSELQGKRSARKAFEEMLPGLICAIGENHSVVLTARSNLAYYTGECGDRELALRLYRELLPDYERVLGIDHRATLWTRSRVAYYTGECGDRELALRLYRELLPDYERVLGADHSATLPTRSWVAYYTGECGDRELALSLFRELLPDRERVLGVDHPDTLWTRHQVAYYTGECGDHELALSLYRGLLPVQERVLGVDHRGTLTTRYQVAYYAGQCGDHELALSLYRELLPEAERVLGADHPDTLTTRRNIAHWEAFLGRTDDAIQTLLPTGDGAALLEVLRVSWTAPSQPGLLRTLWRAQHGDGEARAKLPAELTELSAGLMSELSEESGVDEARHPDASEGAPA